jgi:hypothetical protein
MDQAEQKIIVELDAYRNRVGDDAFLADCRKHIADAADDMGGAPLDWLFRAAVKKRYIERNFPTASDNPPSPDTPSPSTGIDEHRQR